VPGEQRAAEDLLAKGFGISVKRIFDALAGVGIGADDPHAGVPGPPRQEPIANVLFGEKIEIGLNARVEREIFGSLLHDAIGDWFAGLPAIQYNADVGPVALGEQIGFARCKIDAGAGDLVAASTVAKAQSFACVSTWLGCDTRASSSDAARRRNGGSWRLST
jgi:hypothetical protein